MLGQCSFVLFLFCLRGEGGSILRNKDTLMTMTMSHDYMIIRKQTHDLNAKLKLIFTFNQLGSEFVVESKQVKYLQTKLSLQFNRNTGAGAG